MVQSGLADASGCFELTNLRVIWGRVAAVRRNLTIERLDQVFDEFQDKGLLFVWEHDGKRYGHWTGSDVPGRLPPPSWRMRLERLAPPVPKREFSEYVSRFARGRAALAGGGFRAGGVEASGAESCAELHGEGNQQSSPRDLFDSRAINRRGGAVDRRFERPGLEASGAVLRDEGSAPVAGQQRRSGERLHLRGEDRGWSGGVESGFAGRKGTQAKAYATGCGFKDGVEEDQAEDWNWDSDLSRDLNREKGRKVGASGLGLRSEVALESEAAVKSGAAGARCLAADGENLGRHVDSDQNFFFDFDSKSQDGHFPEVAVHTAPAKPAAGSAAELRSRVGNETHESSTPSHAARPDSVPAVGSHQTLEAAAAIGERAPWAMSAAASVATAAAASTASAAGVATAAAASATNVTRPGTSSALRDKAALVARELRVGQGPLCGPVRVKAEALERIRARENALRAKRAALGGARSP